MIYLQEWTDGDGASFPGLGYYSKGGWRFFDRPDGSWAMLPQIHVEPRSLIEAIFFYQIHRGYSLQLCIKGDDWEVVRKGTVEEIVEQLKKQQSYIPFLYRRAR